MKLEALILAKPLMVGSTMENFLTTEKAQLEADMERRVVYVAPMRGKRLVIPFEWGVTLVPAPQQEKRKAAERS